MSSYNPGDLLIFADGRRRCVVATCPEGLHGQIPIVYFKKIDLRYDHPTWRMQIHDVVVAHIPNVFRPEEYLPKEKS